MEFKPDAKDIYPALLVFALCAGFMLYPPKSTLPEFESAIKIEGALEGKQAQPHILFAAFLIRALGLAGDAASIATALLWLAPIVLSLSAVALYLACRASGAAPLPAVLAVLLFAAGPAALASSPGAYSSQLLAMLPLSLFILLFGFFLQLHSPAIFLLCAILAFIAAYCDFTAGLSASLFAFSFAVSAHAKKEKRAGAFLLLSAAAALLSFSFHAPLQPSLSGFSSGLSQACFLLAAASVAGVCFAFGQGRLEHAMLIASGLLALLFSPLASGLLLLLPASDGASQALYGKHQRKVHLSAAFTMAFFILLGISIHSLGIKAALLSAILAALAPLLLHLYEYRIAPFFAILLFALFCVALFSYYLLFPPLPYLDYDLSSSLSFLSGLRVQSAALLSHADAAEFYLQGAKIENPDKLASYLISGSPRLPPGTHIILSLSDLDRGEFSTQGGFESYRYSATLTSQGRSAALFYSPSGRLLLRELSEDGNLSLKDGVLLNSAGQAYASIPLSAMILLKPHRSFSDKDNRLIVIEEGAPIPYFIKIYAGLAGELSNVFSHGSSDVYKVV
ncbi:MAG: hypothetical protein N3E51_02210 [Candidatus Micrarchaeota archaeon]|nr:hypothetical protein [Candidatus Micrarchaeota archaeon]